MQESQMISGQVQSMMENPFQVSRMALEFAQQGLHLTLELRTSLFEHLKQHGGFFDGEGKIHPDLEKTLKKSFLLSHQSSVQVSQITHLGIPLWVGFYPEKNRLLFCSPKAHIEIFLFHWVKEMTARRPTRQYPQSVLRDFLGFGSSIQETLDHFEWTTIEKVTQIGQLVDLSKMKELFPSTFFDLYQQLTQELFQSIRAYKPSLLERLTDFGLRLTARYELFRLHLLKFLALLPSLEGEEKSPFLKKAYLEMSRRFVVDGKAMRKRPGAPPALYRFLFFIAYGVCGRKSGAGQGLSSVLAGNSARGHLRSPRRTRGFRTGSRLVHEKSS